MRVETWRRRALRRRTPASLGVAPATGWAGAADSSAAARGLRLRRGEARRLGSSQFLGRPMPKEASRCISAARRFRRWSSGDSAAAVRGSRSAPASAIPRSRGMRGCAASGCSACRRNEGRGLHGASTRRTRRGSPAQDGLGGTRGRARRSIAAHAACSGWRRPRRIGLRRVDSSADWAGAAWTGSGCGAGWANTLRPSAPPGAATGWLRLAGPPPGRADARRLRRGAGRSCRRRRPAGRCRWPRPTRG